MTKKLCWASAFIVCVVTLLCGLLFFAKSKVEVKALEDEHEFDLTYDGLTHRILVYAPEKTDNNTDVLIMLHGYGSNASAFRQITGMDVDAVKRNYIVVYITGAPDRNDPTSARGWNASWNSGLRESDKDDVGLIRECVKYIRKKYNLKSKRAFVAG